jgi:hypothetical protein
MPTDFYIFRFLMPFHALQFLQVIYSAFYVVSIATGCIYTEAKNYPREPAAHVAISEFAD